MYGKTHTKEWRLKHSKLLKNLWSNNIEFRRKNTENKKGEKNYNYKGGYKKCIDCGKKFTHHHKVKRCVR